MPSLTYDHVACAVLNAITAVLPTVDATAITTNSTWSELEADSVDRVEIVCKAADHLGLAAPDTHWEHATTVGGLVRAVIESARPSPSS
ncbi:acyl carrier protein [Streptomyces sp. NPDC047853]|uniref:acyl carrier protein n=1 Tax=unclassified Streptomyces TaxID=2593676 RepID=UPI0034567DA7